MPKKRHKNPRPKFIRAKYRWSERRAPGIADLSAGMWLLPDGSERPITKKEMEDLLS